MQLYYDSAQTERLAVTLRRQARRVIVVYTILGGVLSGVLGLIVGSIFSRNYPRADDAMVLVVAVVLAVLGGLLGYVAGVQKAFWLRYHAETLSALGQIEQNTRPPVKAQSGVPVDTARP